MRGTPKHTISAKSFIDPLVLTLGKLSGFKPDVAVQSDATYEPTCAHMGITLDQFGKPNGVNSFSTVRWMQAAFKTLISNGWAAREGRGKWKLTPDGVLNAQSLRDAAKSLEDTVSDGTQQAVPLPVSQGHKETSVYHEDAYIRGLAVEQTPCFGAFSDKSDVCTDCPLKNQCLNAMAAHLSRVATLLAKEDEEAEQAKLQPAVKPAVKPSPTGMVKPGPRPATSGAISMSGEVQRITCQQKAICKKCGNVVPKGEDAVWIRSAQASQGPPGIYHVHCYEEG